MKKVIFVLLLSGCATIVSGTKQPVEFTGEKAEIEIIGNAGHIIKKASAPTVCMIPRKREGVTIKANFEHGQERLFVDSSLNYWVLGNGCLLGLFWVGVLIDSYSDAMWKYPDSIEMKNDGM